MLIGDPRRIAVNVVKLPELLSSTGRGVARLPFEFFQFPIAAHASENHGERENDQSDNV
jgi:hypothetical protein